MPNVTQVPGPRVGGHSPWGWIDGVKIIAPGRLWFVATPRHGGLKLSRSMNSQVDERWRRKGGWYEEDIDYAIVMFTHPEFFEEVEVQKAIETLKNWLPDEYQKVTGRIVKPEESFKVREALFKEASSKLWVVTAAWGSWHDAVPKGKVGVVATIGGRSGRDFPERWFLVDEADYDKSGQFGYVIDETKDVEVKPFV